jgi:hypothetical protein
MRGFSTKQLKRLNRPIDVTELYTRKKEGKEFTHITGWYAIAEANAIFGHAGWDRETIALERVFERARFDAVSCGYMARVRVTVRTAQGIVSREGTGFGHSSAAQLSDAHEYALKAAETDATKRALATFGARLGLSLYRQKPAGYFGNLGSADSIKCCLLAGDGSILDDKLTAESFASGLRQLIQQSKDAANIDSLISYNEPSLADLKNRFPKLQSRAGRHYSDILKQLAQDRKAAIIRAQEPPVNIQAPSEPSKPVEIAHASLTNGGLAPRVADADTLPMEVMGFPGPAAGQSIDKSLLTHSTERRIRSKQHLGFVSSKPCLVCEETPCHAHHITYAQARGLSVKVSDEFTVPLCIVHHNQVHQTRPERSWWAAQGLDPLEIAQSLWEETLRGLISPVVKIGQFQPDPLGANQEKDKAVKPS